MLQPYITAAVAAAATPGVSQSQGRRHDAAAHAASSSAAAVAAAAAQPEPVTAAAAASPSVQAAAPVESEAEGAVAEGAADTRTPTNGVDEAVAGVVAAGVGTGPPLRVVKVACRGVVVLLLSPAVAPLVDPVSILRSLMRDIAAGQKPRCKWVRRGSRFCIRPLLLCQDGYYRDLRSIKAEIEHAWAPIHAMNSRCAPSRFPIRVGSTTILSGF